MKTHGVILSLLLCTSALAEGLAPAPRPPELKDDLPLAPYLDSVEAQIPYVLLQGATMRFGDKAIPTAKYVESLRKFVAKGRAADSKDEFWKWVLTEYDFYDTEVFMTSYFNIVADASRTPTERFTRPIYRKPSDLGTTPYLTREEIDTQGKLAGKGLELFWMDSIDAYFLHVQGSGTLRVGDENIRVNYTSKNNHPYTSLSKVLKGEIPDEEMNLHTIEAKLREYTAERRQAALDQNKSYVFFERGTQSSLTSLGVPATDGRTIATDTRYFPKGGVAVLTFDRPEFSDDSALQPVPGGTPVARFVVDQDIGGAITGPARLDLFWGSGNEAKRYAGVMKRNGRLAYLVPKGI